MKVSDDLYLLEVPMPLGETVSIMNLSLVADPVGGLTLIDTGLPGQADLIAEKIYAEGFDVAEVQRVVLTHQDIDHVGSLSALVDLLGVPVIAHATEVPYIDGRMTPIKFPTPERLAQNPAMAAIMAHYRPVGVDRAVADGEVLRDVAGAVVIATPGHTPGHIALYLPGSKTLIAGDSMVAENGVLEGPRERATPNMPQAMESIRRFLDVDIDTIVCYHGGLVTDNPRGQIQRILEVSL